MYVVVKEQRRGAGRSVENKEEPEETLPKHTKATQYQRSQTKFPISRKRLAISALHVLRASRTISPSIHDPSDHAGLD